MRLLSGEYLAKGYLIIDNYSYPLRVIMFNIRLPFSVGARCLLASVTQLGARHSLLKMFHAPLTLHLYGVTPSSDGNVRIVYGQLHFHCIMSRSLNLFYRSSTASRLS